MDGRVLQLSEYKCVAEYEWSDIFLASKERGLDGRPAVTVTMRPCRPSRHTGQGHSDQGLRSFCESESLTRGLQSRILPSHSTRLEFMSLDLGGGATVS